MNYPAPTRCKACGISEATARCRWCGAWKFAAVAALIAVFGLVGSMDYADALIDEAIEKEARPARAAEQPRLPVLSMPIQADATVTQVNALGEIRTRFYVRSSTRRKQQ